MPGLLSFCGVLRMVNPMRRFITVTVATFLFIASCAHRENITFSTNDVILDFAITILDRESPCANIAGRTVIFRDKSGLMPFHASVSDVRNKQARIAAEAVAIQHVQADDDPEIRSFGAPPNPNCSLIVSRPLLSKTFTFITFSTSGEIGMLVLEHRADDLKFIEMVRLGTV